MKTTELFVEQLIIGIAVVLTAAVMVWPEFAAELYRNGAIDLSKVAFVLAGAYLVGIVYDRVADSMLQDLEQHHRLLYALGKIYKAQDERKHRYEPEPVDRFPEGKWRTRVMGAGGAAEHADYLRSRIRLTRALTTMIPAMAVAGALAEGKTTARVIAGLTVLAVYLIAFVSKIARREPLPKPWTTLEEKTEYEWPRTHRVSEEDVRKWYEDRIEYDSTRRRTKLGWQFAVRIEPLTKWALALSAWAGVLGVASHSTWKEALPAGAGIFAASVLGTTLFGWSWWRITQTLYDHLDLAAKLDAR